MSRVLKLQTLIDKGACHGQVDLFRQTFGEAVEVTEALSVKMAGRFDWDWAAAAHLLRAAARAEYDRVTAPAWAECDRVRAAARAECDRVRAAARAEYDRVCAAARAEYDRVRAAALAEYDRVRAAARAEYDRVCAATWARLYNEETET